jgi:hypothetical protein
MASLEEENVTRRIKRRGGPRSLKDIHGCKNIKFKQSVLLQNHVAPLAASSLSTNASMGVASSTTGYPVNSQPSDGKANAVFDGPEAASRLGRLPCRWNLLAAAYM